MKKILCVCIGNSDRSPSMAAILSLFIPGITGTFFESAGIGESAASGGSASPFAIEACRLIGKDITKHKRRHVDQILDLIDYDLFICADEKCAEEVVKRGIDPEKIYNANIPNPWPVHFQEDYNAVFKKILSTMFRIVIRYFS